MEKKILDSKALYVVLSVILAVTMWVYVSSMDGSEIERTIYNIPVQFVGEELLEEKSLMIVGDPPKVSVTVRALPKVFAELDNESITAYVDVSTITAPNENQTMGYTIKYPSDDIVQVDRNPANVSFTVAKYVVSNIRIEGKLIGSVAEDFMEDGFVFEPGQLEVSGRADLVNQIACARVTVYGEDLTESITGEFSYELISNSGEVLEDFDVECAVDTINTTFRVLATKNVLLSVEYISGGGATGANVKATISPASITVAGSKKDVDSITQITLGTIDLAELRDGAVLNFPIPLADELISVSGETEATVSIALTGLRTRTIETTNISFIGAAEGLNPQVITKNLKVEVRGSVAAVDAMTAENVRVVVDLSELEQTSGQYSLTPTIYLDNVGGNIGVLDADGYRVVVSLDGDE